MKLVKLVSIQLVLVLLFSGSAFAASGDAGSDWPAVAKALAFGLAALSAAMGQGRAAATGLDAIGRNPGAQGQIFIPMMVALAFMESIALFGLVLALI